MFVVRIKDLDGYVWTETHDFSSRELLIAYMDNLPDIKSWSIVYEGVIL